MVKAYLRYEQAAGFGAIASSTAAAVPVPNAGGMPLIAAAGVDALIVWNLRKGESVVRFGNSSTRKAGSITSIAVSSGGETLAAGYVDGSIRLWDFVASSVAQKSAFEDEEPQPLVTFNGHRSGISCLSFVEDETGVERKSKPLKLRPTRLLSGSNDGDIILWNNMEDVGLFRIAAHNDAVTAVLFVGNAGGTKASYIASSSKDGMVRVYDVDTQHCVQTIVGHRAEVWAMNIDPTNSILITGSVGAELRCYRLDIRSENEDVGNSENTESTVNLLEVEKEKVFEHIGSAERQRAADRVASISFIRQGGETFVVVAAADKSAEVFELRSSKAAEKHKVRRRRRRIDSIRRECQAVGEEESLDAAAVAQNIENQVKDVEMRMEAVDYMKPVRQLRLASKLRSVSFIPEQMRIPVHKANGIELQLLVQTKSNALEVHRAVIIGKQKAKKRKKAQQETSMEGSDDEPTQIVEKLVTLDFPGHRAVPRSVSLAPDDTTLLSASRRSLKVWNLATQRCIRTMKTDGDELCTALLGADASRGVVGSKEGAVAVYELGSGSLIAKHEGAHKGAVWGMCLDDHIYESNTLITCGADKRICFWGIEDVLVGNNGKLLLSRTLEMPDEVLCVCVAFGRDRPVLLASLMDSTVRAYFLDTLDPYLTFYGHRLPVMAMDVSSDGLMLATGSADKSVKLWGMDFGDCRRSLRAHSDSVISLAFQPNTHYFFSGSRDGLLKYWDGDKFEFIAELEGQSGEVWSVAVSDDGELVVSASHDRMLRVWKRTDEPLFLAEEQDKRMDEMFESTLIDEDLKAASKAKRDSGFMKDDTKGEAIAAGKRSLETVKGGERLLEALELCDEEVKRKADGEEESPNPLMLGLNPDSYMLKTLEQIKIPDLEEALHILPLDAAIRVLEYCSRLLDGNYRSTRLSVEMLSRAALYLIKLHHSQITAGTASRKLISDLYDRTEGRLDEVRQMMGFNSAALQFWRNELADRDDAPFRDASAKAFNAQLQKKKRVKRALQMKPQV